jgi:uncharacterized protein (DUF433 family)
MNGRERITVEPGKRGGKPCIRGMRIRVADVLEYLASGMSEDEILPDFPDVDLRAVLAFAAERERKISPPSAAGSSSFDENPAPPRRLRAELAGLTLSSEPCESRPRVWVS